MPRDAHVCCGDAERLVRAADRWTGSGGTGRFPKRGRRASLVIGKAQGPRISITGLGCYVPDRVLTNDELSTIVDTSDEWIMERTGIRERRIAAPDEAFTDLALPAARDALAQAQLEPRDIDFLVCATVTPD